MIMIDVNDDEDEVSCQIAYLKIRQPYFFQLFLI